LGWYGEKEVGDTLIRDLINLIVPLFCVLFLLMNGEDSTLIWNLFWRKRRRSESQTYRAMDLD
jgi:hypothetical protein